MSKQSTYKEVQIPASRLVAFMQAIHNEGRVGTLTVSFGTGGVPCGMLVWKERIQPLTEVQLVESTPDFNYAL